jgi:hypothetical protein
MNFSQRELVDMFAKFIVANKTIKPEAAGEFMRFIEASRVAQNAPDDADVVAVAIPGSFSAASSSSSSSSSAAASSSSEAPQSN